MSHTTSLRRTASALGATALLGVVLAAPAMARQDSGTAAPAVDSTTSSQFPYGLERSQREGESTTTTQVPHGLDHLRRQSNPTGANANQQLGGFTKPNERSLVTPDEATKQPAPVIVFRDNDAIEYLQVGAGVLAGIVIAGAGAVVVSRRNHGGLTPA